MKSSTDPPSKTEGVSVLRPSSVIDPYPFLDTFAVLTIITVFPDWLSTLALLFYILLGNPRFFESSISLLFKHNLTGLHSDSSEPHETLLNVRTQVIPTIFWSIIYSIVASTILLIDPAVLDYVKLFAKAFLASRLTSTRKRQTFDAIVSSLFILLIENLIQYFISSTELKNIHIWIPSDTLHSSTDLTLSDLFASNYAVIHRNPFKILAYRLSFSRFTGVSTIAFGFEYILQFVYSTLAVYIILSRINPFMKKIVFYDNISKSLDNFSTVALPKRFHMPHTEDAEHLTTSSEGSIHKRPSKGSRNTHRGKSNDYQRNNIPETVEVSNTISRSLLPGLIHNNSHGHYSDPEDSHETISSSGSESGMEDYSEQSISRNEETPASFPLDKQIVIMNDVSSSSLVVAQNFENYCQVVLLPSVSKTLGVNIVKSKMSPYMEKKFKAIKNQQPMWAFVNAAHTMFSKRDLFSGDYYEHNAVVAADPAVEGVPRLSNGSSQLFVWYTGETAVAFELRDITLDQLLIRVNGIIWEHVSSANLYDCELVVVNGLSPLSQYDIEFIKILDNGELRHFATTTVSTIHKNITLTESKPATPITTLQQSVITTQNAIDREKAKLKKLKTDWKKRSSSLKIEIEKLNNRSNVTDEGRNYKKVDSLRQAVAKLDLEASNISKKFEEVYAHQTETNEKYLDERRRYDSQLRYFNSFQDEHTKKVGVQEERIHKLTAEYNQLQQKNVRLTQKKNKIVADINDINDSMVKSKGNEINWRQTQRKDRSAKRHQKYLLLVSDIEKYEKEINGDSSSLH